MQIERLRVGTSRRRLGHHRVVVVVVAAAVMMPGHHRRRRLVLAVVTAAVMAALVMLLGDSLLLLHGRHGLWRWNDRGQLLVRSVQVLPVVTFAVVRRRLRSVLDQRVQTLDLLVLGGVVDRTLAVLIEGQLGAVAEQPSDRGQVAPGRGKVQRRGPVAVAQVRVDALIFDLCLRVVKWTLFS